MIVRNVEKYIGKCLESVKPYFDEFVIVDTGSTDSTKERIWEAVPGARILDFNKSTHPAAFILDAKETWPDVEIPGPFTGKWMLADFGGARQHGWKEVGSDYVMWIDSDDLLVGGDKIQEILADMKKNGVDTAMLNYDYAHDHAGKVTCKLTRERILRRGVGIWVQPIHETVGPIGASRLYEQASIKHQRTEYGIKPEISSRNMKVLLRYFKDKDWNTVDPRMLFYLGEETKFTWPEKSIAAYQKYCTRSGWDEERSVAHMYVGVMYEAQAKYDLAFSEYAQAVVESDFRPEGYFGAARVAYFKRDFRKCAEWTEKGIIVRKKSEEQKSMLMHDPLERYYRPYVYYSAALIELGRHREALDACVEGLNLNPSDPHLKGNKEVAENILNPKPVTPTNPNAAIFSRVDDLLAPKIALHVDVMTMFAIQFWKRHMEARQYDQALNFLNDLPPGSVDASKIDEAKAITQQKIGDRSAVSILAKVQMQAQSQVQSTAASHVEAHSETGGRRLKIVIWTGAAWEVWTPRSIDDGGIGGSETAAVCMARELVRAGNEVIVISECQREEILEGVRYVPYREAMSRIAEFACDVMIVSRQAETVLSNWPSKVSFLWVHDINVGGVSANLNNALVRFDKIFCLSNWHKNFFLQCYPQIHPSTVIVTRNGIDVDRFKNAHPKMGNKIIYSSSPDRGLENLLGMLPAIKAQVPDVELNVYYGFTTWLSMAQSSGNAAFKQRALDLEALLMKSVDEGNVKYHGRVGQKVLAKAFMESKLWTFPTNFTETYCITAIEAQAAGCVPVTTYLAALAETIKHGITLQPPNTSDEYVRDFTNTVVNLLKNENERSKYAEDGRAYAMASCGWDGVAKEWLTIFEEELARKADNVLPFAGDI
jgi:glycosyltransferase involved in cell wall biosynthesis